MHFIDPSRSESHGRKPLLVLPLLGVVVADLYLMLYASVGQMGGWWYLGSSVYAFIGGGFVVMMTGAFSYIADISNRKTR